MPCQVMLIMFVYKQVEIHNMLFTKPHIRWIFNCRISPCFVAQFFTLLNNFLSLCCAACVMPLQFCLLILIVVNFDKKTGDFHYICSWIFWFLQFLQFFISFWSKKGKNRLQLFLPVFLGLGISIFVFFQHFSSFFCSFSWQTEAK